MRERLEQHKSEPCVGCHTLMAHLMWHHPRLAHWVDGRPETLISDGQLDANVMRDQRLTADDVHAALPALPLAVYCLARHPSLPAACDAPPFRHR